MRDGLTYVDFALKGDQPSIQRARTALAPIAAGQPEVMADLRKQPPDLQDAADRLGALLQALRVPANTPDPARAHLALQHILAMPRYAGTPAGLPLWLAILLQILHLIGQLLRALGITRSGIPGWIWPAILFLALAFLVFTLGRAGLSRRAGDAAARRTLAGPPVPDFFREADRAAAAGDYLAAVRWLAGGVAAAISGDAAWRRSPLTVRELFTRSGKEGQLRPLLQTFEDGVYGHRAPTPDAYQRALAAAQPFRQAA